ncbi:MAG: virulence RhuM family protein [Bacteroidales bacterium]|nr:virulence RhuM family protein [Candidatus Colicola coprequi]
MTKSPHLPTFSIKLNFILLLSIIFCTFAAESYEYERKHVDEQNEIVLYQPNELTKLEVRVADETVWLSQMQMTELFRATKQNISLHISNIYAEGELVPQSTVKEYLTVQTEGKRQVTRLVKYYNLDVIISVGYRIKSIVGTRFRQWATNVLREYTLRGYVVNQRLHAFEECVAEHDKKIDFFVRTSLPPVEGVFYNGQIFDAYVFVADLVKSAKKRIVLIDNYVDESVLTLLDKRNKDVTAIIYTQTIDKQLRLDIDKHNAQYAKVDVQVAKTFHDRFLIIDNVVYHVGASIKDLGKKLFAFSKMEMPANEMLKQIK